MQKLFEESINETTKIKFFANHLGFQVIIVNYGENKKGEMEWIDGPRRYHPTLYMALRDVELAYFQEEKTTPSDIKTLLKDVANIRKIILDLDRKYRDKTLEYLGIPPKELPYGHDIQDEAENIYRDVYGDSKG